MLKDIDRSVNRDSDNTEDESVLSIKPAQINCLGVAAVPSVRGHHRFIPTCCAIDELKKFGAMPAAEVAKIMP